MLSIIMPTLNEEKVIERTLRRIKRLDGNFELIVVDGGSVDRTREIAEKYVRVITSTKGRANQMNAGARVARGDVLLFLHADALLSNNPSNPFDIIERALRDKKVVGGALRFHLDDGSLIYKLMVLITNFRANLFRVYTGDFGQFFRRSVFEKIGGYKEIELGEDIEICKRAKREGRLTQLDVKIESSSRRFKQRGVIRTIFLMQCLRFLLFIGVSPKRLKRFYEDIR